MHLDLPKGPYTPQIEFRRASNPVLGQDRPDATTSDGPGLAGPCCLSAPFSQDACRIPRRHNCRFVCTARRFHRLAVVGSIRRHYLKKLPSRSCPFENIGNDPKWDHFADGITEDIVTDLSHSKDLFCRRQEFKRSLQGQAHGHEKHWPRSRRPLRTRRQYPTEWRPNSGDCPAH